MPSVLELRPRQKVARDFYRRWSWRRLLIVNGARLLLLAFLALLLLGGWYLANKGFGRQWRTTVADELRKRGVEASVRRLTLDPFRGLVAQDVRVYEFGRRDKPIALISEIALDINYAALLHRQPFLNALDIRDASVTFPNPGGDPAAPRAQLENFRAHIYFPPEQIVIRQAEGLFCGVRISATGQLLKRHDYQPTREVTEEEWRQRWHLLQRVAAELKAFTFAGDPPSLQVAFAADLSQMEKAHLEATLRGPDIRRGNYHLRDFEAAADWIDQRLVLKLLEWRDPMGAFRGQASYSEAGKAGTFEAASSINLPDLLVAFGLDKFVADIRFASAPDIAFSGAFDLAGAKPHVRATGQLALGNFNFRNIAFLGLAAAFSWDGERAMLRDVRLRHASGEVLADLLDTPGDFRLALESSINPASLRSLVDGGLQKFLGEWEWPRSPNIRLMLHGPSRNPESWRGEGTVAVGRARFRGIWMNAMTAGLRVEDRALTFADLHVARDEGVGTGSFTYDYGRHEVRLDNVRTTLWPNDVIYWIEPDLHAVVVPYKFKAAPRLVANGVVQYEGGSATRLEIAVEAGAGLDYVFLGETLPFTRAAGDILITDDRVQLLNLTGTLYDGKVRTAADIATGRANDRVAARVEVEGVDFPALTKLYFDYESARGQLFGQYEFTMQGDEARTMVGQGKLRIANGNVFAIPVLGPLSGIVAEIIPGAGYSVAKEATASFAIANGIITTDDFKVSGKLFGLKGGGKIHFLEDKLDFEVRVDARGPGVLLTPVYELFEYKGEGSLKNPKWGPKRF